MLREARMLLLLLLHGATAYEFEEVTTDAGTRTWVKYPDGASEGVPLVVHLHGTTIDPSPNQGGGTLQPSVIQNALDAGFAFAILEWPAWEGSDTPGYPTSTITSGFDTPQYCDLVADKAAKLFGHAETTSLSVLCKLDQIDCSKGVGVAGYSQGASIGSMAAMLDNRVTAFFGIASNTVVIYRDDGQAEEATCFRDATLDPSARRYLNGGDDVDWTGGNAIPWPITPDWPGAEPVLLQDNLAFTKYAIKPTSGYDCGEENDCLQSDGSGYFIVPGVSHEDIYAGTEDLASYGPMMNGFEWLMGRTTTDTPGCPCPEGSRRKLLFASMPDASTCCARAP